MDQEDLKDKKHKKKSLLIKMKQNNKNNLYQILIFVMWKKFKIHWFKKFLMKKLMIKIIMMKINNFQ